MQNNFEEDFSSSPSPAQHPPTVLAQDSTPPRRSPKIAAALAKAQAKFIQPEKNKTVTVRPRDSAAYSFEYADYGAIVKAVVGPLAENGICFTHLVEYLGNHLVLITKLIHESGEELLTYYPLPDVRDAKQFGGAMTYGKRYSLSAITGCVADDDADADPDNTTAFANRAPQPPRQAAPATVITPKAQPPAESAPAPSEKRSGPPTDAQKARLFTIAEHRGWTKEQVKLCMDAHWGLSSTSHLTQAQYQKLCEMIEGMTYTQAIVAKVKQSPAG